MKLLVLVPCAALLLALGAGCRDAGPVSNPRPALARTGRALSTEAWTIRYAEAPGTRFGAMLAGAGDVDGDGFADLLVGEPEVGPEPGVGAVHLYRGGAGGIEAAPSWTVRGPDLGKALDGAGDVNGDGFDDVILGAPRMSAVSDRLAAAVYLGSPGGLGDAPVWTITEGFPNASIGWSVAGAGDVDGDGFADVLVGAPEHEAGGTPLGAVFLFRGRPGGLSPTPSWHEVGAVPRGRFGFAVAGAGDVNGDGYADVIVGAPNQRQDTNEDEVEPGSVYVYHGSPTGPEGAPSWSVSDPLGGTLFGWDVASAGDANRDGYADVVIASPRQGYTSRAAEGVVYFGSPEGLGDSSSRICCVGGDFSSLAMSVDGLGDVDGDGYADAAAGAGRETSGASPVLGRAVAVRFGSAVSSGSSPDLGIDCEEEPNGGLGSAVAGAGDVDGDGYADLAVGNPRPGEPDDTTHGSFRLYRGRAEGPLGLGDMTEGWEGRAAGTPLAVDGDIDGDGYDDELAGASVAASGTTLGAGRLSIRFGARDPRLEAWRVASVGSQTEGGLGASVAHLDDVDGDGFGDVAVGEPGYDGIFPNAGRVQLFRGTAGGLADTAAWSMPGLAPGAAFGSAVAGVGDMNGDGLADLVVGAPTHSDLETGGGRVHLYFGSLRGLPNEADWMVGAETPGTEFGYAVAGAGDVDGDGYGDLLIGAPRYNDVGAVFLFRGRDGEPWMGPGHMWSASGEHAGSRFGHAVAGLGDMNGDGYADVLIAAPGTDGGVPEEGRAYLYLGSATGLSPTPAATLGPPDDEVRHFGAAVAAAGDLDGDGLADLYIAAEGVGGASTNGRINVYYGATDPGTLERWFPVWMSAWQAPFVSVIAGGGDLDGDGIGDVVAGHTNAAEPQAAGSLFLFLGNARNGRDSAGLRPVARRLGTRLAIHDGGRSGHASAFDVALLAHSPSGRQRMKLEVEAKPFGVPFDGQGLVTSDTWTDVGPDIVELTRTVSGLETDAAYHWRARLRFDPSQAPPQGWSRWMYGGRDGGTASGMPFAAHVRMLVACREDADCDDDDPCTLGDACDRDSGACVTSARLDCDDGNACTEDRCDGGFCSHVGLSCDDHDPCTVDSCHPATGCANTPLPCGDDEPCTEDLCDPMVGCWHPPRDCDDGDPCTTDACEPGVGCRHAPLACEDGDACNGEESCAPGLGCVTGPPPDCDDEDACTVDSCDPLPGCVHEPVDCADQNACTQDGCDAVDGCRNTPLVPCTLSEGCWHNPRARIEITAPGHDERVDLGMGAAGPETAGDVTIRFAWAVPAGQTGALALYLDQRPVEVRVPPVDEVVLAALPAGAHTLTAMLADDDGVPYCGGRAVDVNRFYVSRLCTSATQCADDDPCTVSACIGDPTDPLDRRCRFGPVGGDADCCVTKEWCRFRGLFYGVAEPQACIDVDDDDVGDCVPCAVDADCVLSSPCHAAGFCTEEGACDFELVPECCTQLSHCNDHDVCTVDACDRTRLRCLHDRTPACCTSDADCAAAYPEGIEPGSARAAAYDGCALKVCIARRCHFGRDPERPGCCGTSDDPDFGCFDRNACTVDACVTAAGQSPGGEVYSRCVFALDLTGDGVNECCARDADCGDGDPATLDRCNFNPLNEEAGGVNRCWFPLDPDYCRADADCEDGDPCTDERCGLGERCVRTPRADCCRFNRDCIDGRACTADACCAGARPI